MTEAGCDSYLQEVLAGADEGQLSAGAVRLRLAASDSLNQLRDLLCHHLMTHTHKHRIYCNLISNNTMELPVSFYLILSLTEFKGNGVFSGTAHRTT